MTTEGADRRVSRARQWRAVPAAWMVAPCVDRPDGTVGELIAAQATIRPDAIAVRQWDSRLTYAELVAAARRLAGTLREHGVGPETRVGVCVGRHPGLLVALVGVLLSGGAYVPLDPDLPPLRLTDTARAAGVDLRGRRRLRPLDVRGHRAAPGGRRPGRPGRGRLPGGAGRTRRT